MSKYAEKICDILTLLKYAKNAAKCGKYAAIAYSRFSDMPNWQSDIGDVEIDWASVTSDSTEDVMTKT